MCLAIPAKIISIRDGVAQCDIAGNRTAADMTLLPDAVEGDYVIVHAGMAIQKYDELEARETLKALRDYAGLDTAIIT